MSEENKAVVSRWFDAVNHHDLDTAAGMVASDFVSHSSTNQGRDGLRAELAYWLTAFPDASVPVEIIISDGDLVAVRHRVVGTHSGEFLGVPPTGNRVSVHEMDIFRVENGVIVESWSAPDLHGMLSQISAGSPWGADDQA